MNVDDLEKKITRNTRLICPVHMGGISCKVDEIKEIVDYYSKNLEKKYIQSMTLQEQPEFITRESQLVVWRWRNF